MATIYEKLAKYYGATLTNNSESRHTFTINERNARGEKNSYRADKVRKSRRQILFAVYLAQKRLHPFCIAPLVER